MYFLSEFQSEFSKILARAGIIVTASAIYIRIGTNVSSAEAGLDELFIVVVSVP
jgi:hypothetical protein